MPQLTFTLPWIFNSLSGDQPASTLDDDFNAIQNATLTMGIVLLSASSAVVDPDNNYSRFLCTPVTDMDLTLPGSVSTGFGFWFNNLNAASPPVTVTLIGTVTIDGTPVNNPVFPGDFGSFTNVRGGLVVWDGSIWTMYPQFQ